MADNPAPLKKVDPAVKWGALFVIGLMLLSAAAVYFGSQSAGDDANSADPNAPSGSIAVFTADDVSGIVTDVFQSVVVGGTTGLSDKTAIDEALNQVSGVQSLTSQFTNLNSTDGSLTYVATITLKENTEHAAFVQDVQTLGLFTAPEIYFQAAVEVPTTLNAMDNANQSQPITLPNPIIQGFITGNTRKGDKISGHLTAQFQGAQYTVATIIEIQNVSASPTPLVFTGAYTLARIEPALTLAGSVKYYPGLSAESLQAGISGVQGVTGASTPIIPQVNTALLLAFDEADAVFEDVNAFVTVHSDQFSDVQLVENGLRVGLKNTTLNAAKSALTTVIQQALLSNASIAFTDPQTQFFLDVNTGSLSTQPVVDNLSAYFLGLDANVDVEIFQKGSVDANALVSPETNEHYPVENGMLHVSIFPGHAVGDRVSLQIETIAIRGELVYVNAAETRSVDANAAI